MVCGLYEEFSNGLKMSLVGVAVGAIAWLFLGTGAKESYYKRRHERESEERRAEHEREKRAHERELAQLKAQRQAAVVSIGRGVTGGWTR